MRVELGLLPPAGEHLLVAELPSGWRIVASMPDAASASEVAQARLRRLVEAFGETTHLSPHGPQALPSRRARDLHDLLESLAERTGAETALVVDVQSPVVWGSSRELPAHFDAETAHRLVPKATPEAFHCPPELDLELAQRAAGANAQRFAELLGEGDVTDALWQANWRAAVALVDARDCEDAERWLVCHDSGGGWLARGFGGIYRLVLVFERAFSEPAVRGTLRRALPIVARVVEELPPRDPTPGVGVVHRLGPPKSPS